LTGPASRVTTPPRRYSEASLVKDLEEFGIGRPSTYASILSTIVDRKYVDHGEEADQERLRYEFLNPTAVPAPSARCRTPGNGPTGNAVPRSITSSCASS